MIFLIADDHPIFRSGMTAMLKNGYPDVEVVEKENGEEALQFIIENEPEIAILDIDMPKVDGLEIVEELYKKNILTRVIILTMYNEAEMLRKSLQLGAKGYLVKDETADELLHCIESVLKGEQYVAKKLQKSPEIRAKIRENEAIIEKLKQLTQTELKTIKLVSKKFSSKEISEHLFVSPKSVENYRSRICKKLELDAKNNTLLLWAIENEDLINSVKD